VLNDKTHPVLWFREVCLKNGVQLSDHQLGLLERYVALLLEWNKKINLISRKDEENVWPNHILHSASLLFKFSFPHSAKVVDIGTGGGLPGIPLKIIQPDLNILLIDSTQKKIDAIQHMLAQLGLDRISAIWGRAEDIGKRAEYAGKFDIAVARAVAPLKDLIAWSRPLLKKSFGSRNSPSLSGGRRPVTPPALIAMKGGDISSEVEKATRAREEIQLFIESLQFDEIGIAALHDKKVIYIAF
jgi:16S rRNA (guanine527-N7)-methyltransferase